jgi:hypothetical protein
VIEMFLHSGASLHGHEYSPINTPTARRSPLVRAAFSVPPPRLSTYDSTKPAIVRPARRLSADHRKTSERVSFSEPEVEIMSDDGFSYASEGSEATAGGTKKKKRKSTRCSTSYQLAHPAPTLTRQQKLLHIRPKLLLQLQRFSSDKRPLPVVDVLPSIVVVPRLMKRFPRMFKGEGQLGANDVLVVKSENYDTPDDDNDGDLGDDESCANREVLAVICQLRGLPGSSEICLGDGSVWYATPMPKGVFEFVTTDPATGEKTVARWVQRVSPRRHSSLPTTSGPGSSVLGDYKYLFSILHPNSRRHPILASLTQKILDIPDNYTTVSSSAGRYPPTSPLRGSMTGWQPVPEEEDNLERTTLPIDDNTRTLIQVTGLWLALRLGWCPYFKYDDIPALTATKSASTALPNPGARTCSTSVANDPSKGLVLDTRSSTPESNPGSRNAAGGKIFRSGNHIFRSSPASISPTSFDQTAPIPRRAVSTGTAYMQRAAARRAGNLPSTVASYSEGELGPSPMRVATSDDVTMSLSDRKSMPLPPANLDPLADAPETPTRSFHRRVQSVFMPSSPLHRSPPNGVTGHANGHSEGSYDGAGQKSGGVQQRGEKKGGRWNALIRFLRRGEQSAK